MDINNIVGRARTRRDDHPCATCGTRRLHTELNWEGNVHHGTKVECIDRRSCERRRRKAAARDKRRSLR